MKKKMMPKKFCVMQNCEFFTEIAEYIYGLKFDEKPNYNFLRFTLTKNLIDLNLFPDK